MEVVGKGLINLHPETLFLQDLPGDLPDRALRDLILAQCDEPDVGIALWRHGQLFRLGVLDQRDGLVRRFRVPLGGGNRGVFRLAANLCFQCQNKDRIF